MGERSDFIFIAGPERAGTTLLATLLDRHSELAVPPETHFMPELWAPARRATWAGDQPLLALLAETSRVADAGVSMEAVSQRFREGPATFEKLLASLLQTYAEARAKPRAGEKTPVHLKYLSTLLGWYPEAKAVLIVRDGRDCVRSMKNVPWGTSNMRFMCGQWHQMARLTRRMKQRFPDRVELVYFEQLLRAPEQTLRQVDAWCGLAFEPTQLDSAEDTGTVPDWEQAWKSKVSQKLDPSRIAAWREEAGTDQLELMNAIMGPELARHGYETPAAHAGSPSRTLSHRAQGLVLRGLYLPRVYRLANRIKAPLERLGLCEKLFGRARRSGEGA